MKLGETRKSNPQGTWSYDHIKGAKVKVKSTPIANLDDTINTTDTYTVEDVYFNVSIDGKVVTLIKLKEAPDDILTWKDVYIVDIRSKILGPKVGEVNVGNFKL